MWQPQGLLSDMPTYGDGSHTRRQASGMEDLAWGLGFRLWDLGFRALRFRAGVGTWE